jgi:hypothetical protein
MILDELKCWCYPQPKCMTPWPPPTSMDDSLSHAPPLVDLSTVSDQLQLLVKAISSLRSQGNSPPSHLSRKLSQPAPDGSQPSPILASTMSRDEVMSLLHHAGSSLPPICPCNTANASDTKTHWPPNELHRVMGCQKCCNYKHLMQLSTFDLVALFVSALNLHRDCPLTLSKALANLHPDWEVWLKSYQEEKGGLQSLDTYHKITLGEYHALHKKGGSARSSYYVRLYNKAR